MRIGLTYDLRQDYLAEGYSLEETAECDKIETIEGIESALRELGYATDRIGNGKKLIGRLAAGDRWDLVFNIAEGLHGAAREGQVPAILDMHQIPYTFSDPLALGLALQKDLTKTVIRQAGVPTPRFAVVRRMEDLETVDLPFPLFAKPAAEGTSKGINADSKISDRDGLKKSCAALLERFRQPVLIEAYLSGREFTVGITGTDAEARVVGTLEVSLTSSAKEDFYSYHNKQLYDTCMDYTLVRPEKDDEVRQCEALALTAYRCLGCRDAGRVDFRSDAQARPNFIEINPLPGLNEKDSDLPILCRQLGIGYVELIERIVTSARRRM
ncbi:MAG: D-alanine--D-alanine ligase [Pirellulales bacterium]|nr:D-alanine--D-alanine ligase [Pirellulales bacterium]